MLFRSSCICCRTLCGSGDGEGEDFTTIFSIKSFSSFWSSTPSLLTSNLAMISSAERSLSSILMFPPPAALAFLCLEQHATVAMTTATMRKTDAPAAPATTGMEMEVDVEFIPVAEFKEKGVNVCANAASRL